MIEVLIIVAHIIEALLVLAILCTAIALPIKLGCWLWRKLLNYSPRRIPKAWQFK
jgi:hypothetical protein